VRFSRRAILGPLVIGKPKNFENKNKMIAQEKFNLLAVMKKAVEITQAYLSFPCFGRSLYAAERRITD
jgi:hypothetical protein